MICRLAAKLCLVFAALCLSGTASISQSILDARLGQFATVLQGHAINRVCETIIGERAFELEWNFLQTRAALRKNHDEALYEAARNDKRFTGLKNPECKTDQTKTVENALLVSRKLVVDVGGQPHSFEAFNHYLRNDFARVVFGRTIEGMCKHRSPANRKQLFDLYDRIVPVIDARGVEDMPFPEDIISDARETEKTCDAKTERYVRDGADAARDLGRYLGIWSLRTGFVGKASKP